MSACAAAPRLSTRQGRAVVRLVNGDVDREELDRIAGSTNSPDIVRQLRRKGIGINMQRIDALDRDGRACWFGRYSLTADGRRIVQQWGWSA